MKLTLSPPFRRSFAVAVLIFFVVVCFVTLINPIIKFVARDEQELVQAKIALQLYKKALLEKKAWDGFSSNINREAASQLFLSGSSDPLLAARFQSIIKQMIERAGGTVKSSQPINIAEKNGLKRIAVRLDFLIPMGSLLGALHIEDKNPIFFIDSLSIHAPQSAIKKDKGEVLLQVSADYYAFVMP